MFLVSDYITPSELTGYTRAALADYEINTFTLSRFLPSRQLDDLVYRFSRGGQGLTDAAAFRTWDAEAQIGSRPAVSRITGELPPLSRKLRLSEYENLRMRNLPGEIRTQLLTDAERLARSIAARIELARGEALNTGKMVISENGVIATVDFGRSAGHDVTAGTLWTDTTNSDPISNLLSWRTTYITDNGVAPAQIICSQTVIDNMLRNSKVRTMLASVVGTPSIVSIDQLQSLLRAFQLPPIEPYDVQVNVSGSGTRVIPTNRVIFLPPNSEPLGNTFWGSTVRAMELQTQGAFVNGSVPGAVSAVYKTEDPVALWTIVDAIALPVVANPDLTFAATVG